MFKESLHYHFDIHISLSDGLRNNLHFIYTVCPRSLDPFVELIYHMKWVETSWTYSMVLCYYMNKFEQIDSPMILYVQKVLTHLMK